MKVLFVGDIVGSRGCEFACFAVRRLKAAERIDLVVANGENSADGNGISYSSYQALCEFADVITTGNHAFRRRDFCSSFDDLSRLLRPANYSDEAAGRGVCTIDLGRHSLTVINLQGTAFMLPLENPFDCIDRLLKDVPSKNILVDFHAEATSEKKALGFYLDGRVSAVVGTHTHVQTADETILPRGTAYITDAGMCGAELSCLGVKPELVIRKQRLNIPVAFEEADGERIFGGVLIDIDEKSGRSNSIKRICIKEKEV